MLTDIIEVKYDKPTPPKPEELPTYGIVNDGRTYPAVSVRQRQHQKSRRGTIFTVSKFGTYREFYDDFEREYITPYFERKADREGRKEAGSGGDVQSSGGCAVDAGTGTAWTRPEWEYIDSFTASTVE